MCHLQKQQQHRAHDLRKYFKVNCFRLVYLLNWKGKSSRTFGMENISPKCFTLCKKKKVVARCWIADIRLNLALRMKKTKWTIENSKSKAIIFFFFVRKKSSLTIYVSYHQLQLNLENIIFIHGFSFWLCRSKMDKMKKPCGSFNMHSTNENHPKYLHRWCLLSGFRFAIALFSVT